MNGLTELWRGKFLRVMKSGHWEYADRIGATGAVVIVALTPENKLVLTEQYRIPLGKRVLELPAGLSGDQPGEDEELAEAARRELLEETGYEADGMELLTDGPPSAGLSTETVAFFRATGLKRKTNGGGHGDEEIQVHEIPLEQVQGWLEEQNRAGLLVDPKIYAGLFFLRSA